MELYVSNYIGASYAGAPKDYTFMYISKKVEYLVKNLVGKKGCLIFVETGVDIPEVLKENHRWVETEHPQYEYAKFANQFYELQEAKERKKPYIMTKDGYYIGDNVRIGKDAYIEPGVVLGHSVSIGDHAIILAGSVIKYATIGDDFVCNEHAVIGNASYTMADDEHGNRIRIPSLGKVVIGDSVEIGANNTVARGASADTVIDDYVKTDASVYIAHEVHLYKNVKLTSGVCIGGYSSVGEGSYLGMNSSVRNRIKVGENTMVGMGAVVTHDVKDHTTVVGNPAKILE